jgi:hypothetical protein
MIQDIRYDVRMSLRQPWYSAVVLLRLALGIGVNAAAFTVYNALALKPLPLKDVDSIVVIWAVPETGRGTLRFSYPDYRDYSARTKTMAGLALTYEMGATIGIEHVKQGAESQREEFGTVNCQLVSSSYFSLFGANMEMGRDFFARRRASARRESGSRVEPLFLGAGLHERSSGARTNRQAFGAAVRRRGRDGQRIHRPHAEPARLLVTIDDARRVVQLGVIPGVELAYGSRCSFFWSLGANETGRKRGAGAGGTERPD